MLPEIITLDYLTKTEEGQYIDRKSARIKPSDIARHLVAFANANGGILVIGIEDGGEVTGFGYDDAKSLNEFLDIPYTMCVGSMKVATEQRKINVDNREDVILLFFVEPSEDCVIKTSDGKVYLRVGDKSRLLNHDQVTQLEYDGVKMETGQRLNLIKELNYEMPIPRIIQEVRTAINLQLREFQYLDENGVFRIIPEYPEFAWFEGIVNS